MASSHTSCQNAFSSFSFRDAAVKLSADAKTLSNALTVVARVFSIENVADIKHLVVTFHRFRPRAVLRSARRIISCKDSKASEKGDDKAIEKEDNKTSEKEDNKTSEKEDNKTSEK